MTTPARLSGPEASPLLSRVTMRGPPPLTNLLSPLFLYHSTRLCDRVLPSSDTFRHPQSRNHRHTVSGVKALCPEPGSPQGKQLPKPRFLLAAHSLHSPFPPPSGHLVARTVLVCPAGGRTGKKGPESHSPAACLPGGDRLTRR